MELDPDTQTIRVDWHGYASIRWKRGPIASSRRAWEHGLRYVEFVHGAADVPRAGRSARQPGGRGPRASEGRPPKRLYRGQWRRWAQGVRLGNHQIDEGRMLIACSRTPSPIPARAGGGSTAGLRLMRHPRRADAERVCPAVIQLR
jgi:hypothetical protein